MTLRALVMAAALGLVALPASASQCPTDMRKIDAALAQNTQLSEADMAKVRQLREEGEKLHEAGDHAASVETLAEAKQLLGVE